MLRKFIKLISFSFEQKASALFLLFSHFTYYRIHSQITIYLRLTSELFRTHAKHLRPLAEDKWEGK